MKKPFLSAAILLLAFAFTPVADPITGQWIHKNSHGDIVEKIEFRSDGTFIANLPTEHYVVGGKYKFKKDILLVSDTACNALYWGKYSIAFQGKDSITPAAIEDTCIGRKMSADKMLFTRE